MSEPITLTKAFVIEKAREAYLAGRLSAQNGVQARCFYRDEAGFPCVIGAALSDEAAKSFDRLGGISVSALLSDGMIKTPVPEFLVALQLAHDDWACAGDEDAHAELRKLLGITA